MHYADFLIDFAIKCFLSFWDCTFLLAGSHTQVLTKLHHRAELMQVMNVCSSASFLLLAQIRLDDASRMQWFDIDSYCALVRSYARNETKMLICLLSVNALQNTKISSFVCV